MRIFAEVHDEGRQTTVELLTTTFDDFGWLRLRKGYR